MSEEEARKRQIEAARATREYAPVMAQEVSMSEHTPGPWKSAEYFNGDCLRVIQSGSGATIAKMSKDWPGIDIEANARLIAAAPALLAALKAILDVLKPDSLGYLQGDVNLLTCEHMIQAREAIKAGKAP